MILSKFKTGYTMKKTLLCLSIFLSLSLQANTDRLKETPYQIAKMYIGHGEPYFLEVGAESCPSCKIMGYTLKNVKEEHPKYNILYINVGDDREIAQQLKVQMIPTQIIYDEKGAEVYRHVGKLNELELDEIFEKYHF